MSSNPPPTQPEVQATLNYKFDGELDKDGWNEWFKIMTPFMSSSQPHGSDALLAASRTMIEREVQRRAIEERDGHEAAQEAIKEEKASREVNKSFREVNKRKRALETGEEEEEDAEWDITPGKRVLMVEAEHKTFMAEIKRRRLRDDFGAQTSKMREQAQNPRKEGPPQEERVYVRNFKDDQASKLLAEAWKRLEEDEQRGRIGGKGNKRKADSESSLSYRIKKTGRDVGGKATGA